MALVFLVGCDISNVALIQYLGTESAADCRGLLPLLDCMHDRLSTRHGMHVIVVLV